MLQKEELIKLLRNEKYSDIRNIFRREYKRILMEFAQKNGINVEDEPPLTTLINMIELKFPELVDYTSVIGEACFVETDSLEESLSLMIDNYNEIKEVFK